MNTNTLLSAINVFCNSFSIIFLFAFLIGHVSIQENIEGFIDVLGEIGTFSVSKLMSSESVKYTLWINMYVACMMYSIKILYQNRYVNFIKFILTAAYRLGVIIGSFHLLYRSTYINMNQEYNDYYTCKFTALMAFYCIDISMFVGLNQRILTKRLINVAASFLMVSVMILTRESMYVFPVRLYLVHEILRTLDWVVFRTTGIRISEDHILTSALVCSCTYPLLK